MATNDYHFITHWHLPNTTVREVSEILGNGPDLARWWPSVYLGVKELVPGDPQTGIGKVIDLYTKGWLPYTLRWQFRVTDTHPNGFSLTAWGDFIGRGIWTFEQENDAVNVTYDWKVSAGKPLLRNLSFLLKPVFSANHHWAMRMGYESLLIELARRHAKSPTERALIPAPTPATTTSPAPMLLLLAAGVLAIWALTRRKR